jgi:SsrA-binding protein
VKFKAKSGKMIGMNNRISNRYATYEYQILEKFETGIVLRGDEIKAVRSGRVNLKGSYAKIFYTEKGHPEVFLVGAHFYSATQDPYRTRKLLLNKQEVKKLIGMTQEKGLALVPSSIYLKKGMAKVELAIGRGKKIYDKRETIKKRDLERAQRRFAGGTPT